MKFDELDKKMRVYETNSDLCVLPNMFMVARLDGRNFTKLTKETHNFKRPFDEVFRDYMVETSKHLMNCGFKVIYAYTQSDEISLLFAHQEKVFKRKTRKYNSVLAGEASAKFSLLLKDMGIFDSRICQLPNLEIVVDYFRWRNEDAFRNSLNAHCYWKLRDKGLNIKQATERIKGLSTADKNELLFQEGINFNNLPNWHKRGVGIYWEDTETISLNPKTNLEVSSIRKKIKIDYNLPMKESYSQFVERLVKSTL